MITKNSKLYDGLDMRDSYKLGYKQAKKDIASKFHVFVLLVVVLSIIIAII